MCALRGSGELSQLASDAYELTLWGCVLPSPRRAALGPGVAAVAWPPVSLAAPGGLCQQHAPAPSLCPFGWLTAAAAEEEQRSTVTGVCPGLAWLWVWGGGGGTARCPQPSDPLRLRFSVTVGLASCRAPAPQLPQAGGSSLLRSLLAFSPDLPAGRPPPPK